MQGKLRRKVEAEGARTDCIINHIQRESLPPVPTQLSPNRQLRFGDKQNICLKETNQGNQPILKLITNVGSSHSTSEFDVVRKEVVCRSDEGNYWRYNDET